MISNEVTHWMFENHGHRLTEGNNTILNAAALQTYADAVASKGAALANCFGFVDGTLRQISRALPFCRQETVVCRWRSDCPLFVAIGHFFALTSSLRKKD